jgi:hypothetical protein
MLIPNDEIIRAFRKVKAVRDHMKLYHVDGQSHRLSVDTLKATVEDMYGLSITMNEVVAPGAHAEGAVERYKDNRALILVRADLSDDEKRFVAVKELCHLMVDEEDDWSAAGVETLRLMKIEFDLLAKDGDGVPNPCRAQISEYLAWIAALALMYPCEFHAGDRARLDAEETTITKLGLYHGMPSYQLESALTHPKIFSLYEGA